MSTDPIQPRTQTAEPLLALARREVAADDAGLLERAAEAVDDALAPVDRFKDGLSGGIARTARTAEVRTRGTLLGALVQFLNGAGAAAGAVVEGTYQTIRHPIQTVKGLWAMASHVPLSPPWLYRAVKEGPSDAFAADRRFWGAVASGMIEPYRRDWQDGRYFAVAGRAAFEIGTLYLSAKKAMRTYDAWKARRGAGSAVDEAARMSGASADEGLKAAVLGDEARATGQVIPEGQVVVGEVPAKRPKVDMRAQMERARERYQGNRRKLRTKAIEQIKQERLTAPKPEPGSLRRLKAAEVDRTKFRRLQQVGHKRLATDGELQQRYYTLTRSVDRRMDRTIHELVGHMPEGSPKHPVRAAAKLELRRAELAEDLRLGDLEDLTRGRINLPGHSTKEIRRIVEQLKGHFGENDLVVKDYLNARPFYKGRVHVKIRDGSGLWYELQIGARQLTDFYDTPFLLNGRSNSIHDAVYKGLMMLDDDAVKLLGKGNLKAGSRRLAEVLHLYVDEMKDVMHMANKQQPYDFMRQTETLRAAIADLVDELPAERLPVGLQ